MTSIIKYFLSLTLVVILFSCASYSPIFDKNKKFIDVGEKVANEDFVECKKEAENYLDQYKLKKATNEARRKAIVGGLFGGLFGLVVGNSAQSVVGGAVGGSLFGGLYGGLSSLGEDKIEPDEVKKNYITRCLNRKEYEIIGWY